jgi:hypothetical protein
MWIREHGWHPGQACAESGDFFTEAQGFTDKKVLENQFPYTKKFILR